MPNLRVQGFLRTIGREGNTPDCSNVFCPFEYTSFFIILFGEKVALIIHNFFTMKW